MNSSSCSFAPLPDMEEGWKRSLIRVTDEFTLPPFVLRVDDAIIGTELNNKAESVLLITKDNADADRSIVPLAIIRSKAFLPFAFRLSEDEGICLPKLEVDYTAQHAQVVAYQELSHEVHRKALQEVFAQDAELGYGDLLTRLNSTYFTVAGHTYRQTKLKELLRFLLRKGMIIKEGRGRYRFNSDQHH